MTNGTLMLLYVMRKLIHCYQSESVSQIVSTGYVKIVSAFCSNTENNAEMKTDVALKLKKEELCNADVSPRCQH